MQTSVEQKLRTFVVLNPVAGQREPLEVEEIVESRLKQRGIDYEIYKTTGQENIRQVVEQAIERGSRLVIACGGDGTVSASASAMVGKDVYFAIVPAGTWNALARNLDIPLDIGAAMDLVFEEHGIRTIDVLDVEGKYFLLNVSVGTGSLILRTIERDEIRRFGKWSYIGKGVMQMMGYPPHRFRVTYDGKPTSFRARELIVANSGIMGIKNMRLDLDIHLDDGKFNICRIQANSLWDYLAIGISMLTGKQRKDPRLVCWEALDQVRIESTERLPVQADGEVVGQLPIVIKLRRKALHIIIPAKPAE